MNFGTRLSVLHSRYSACWMVLIPKARIFHFHWASKEFKHWSYISLTQICWYAHYIDGLIENCGIPSASAMEILQSVLSHWRYLIFCSPWQFSCVFLDSLSLYMVCIRWCHSDHEILFSYLIKSWHRGWISVGFGIWMWRHGIKYHFIFICYLRNSGHKGLNYYKLLGRMIKCLEKPF